MDAEAHECTPACTVNSCKVRKRAYDEVYREKNRAKRRAQSAAWKSAHPKEVQANVALHAATNRARAAKWAKEHPEIVQKRSAKWRQEHPEETRVHQLKYERAHPDVKRANAAKRRARLNAARGTYTESDVQQRLIVQEHRCLYCLAPLGKYHVDHMTPLSRGGSNGPENIACACPICNLRKGSKTATEFMRENM